jgi:hypothetical protein
MKKIILFFLFLTGFTFSIKAQSEAEIKVAAAVEKLRLAMINGNRADLENITANDLSYGHSGGKLEDKSAFIESIASGKSDFVTIDLTDQTIKTTDKTAIVRHKLYAKTNDNNVPAEVHLGVILVWQKQGKDWKLLARQAYKLPTK